MPIDKWQYVLEVVKKNPGEIAEVLLSMGTTFKYRVVKRCIGRKSIVRNRTRIVNTANVTIGEDCILQDHVYIRAGMQGRVIFGNGCMINSFCRFFGHGGIEVGDGCQFGPGVTITTTEHDYRSWNLSEVFRNVTIGKRVWVGANVTILPGAEIGDFAVIGAGSVVSRKIPPRSLALGIPARVVMRFDEGSEMQQHGEMEDQSWGS